LARVRAGDETANRTLVEILYPTIRANVRNHLRRRDDHDDVVQEVFMKIFLKIEQYSGPQPFEHWVSRIAVTTCYDWLRKRKARPLVSYSDLSEAERKIITRTLKTEDAGQSGSRRELFSGLLDKLISSLKPREQIVIRLLDLEELSVKEVTELTGWGASKVKVTAMRARRKLADQLQRLEQPGQP
ncbi:MAG: RNA polymerase sigma factor, partial [Akkermansiaceae bacterium]|nr:RNA polymerase sigma factor [Akkermansiaceae bacterium]